MNLSSSPQTRRVTETPGQGAAADSALESDRAGSPEVEPVGVQAFLYPEATQLPGGMRSGADGSPASNWEDSQEAAHAQAFREGGEHAATLYAADLGREREVLGRALDEFAQPRAEYFLNIEREAVQLTLAIARKILQREASADPLALAAMVHVALAPLHTGTVVALHVHPAAAQDWRLHFAARANASPQLETQPQVVEDVSVPEGECSLETEMGTAALSLSQQMESIEASFLDLLAQRPGGSV